MANSYRIIDEKTWPRAMHCMVFRDNEEDKRAYRDEHFESDLKAAYELGKRLVQKAKEQ